MKARRRGVHPRGAAGLARVDFFVTSRARVLLNELNTVPGFTATSVFAMMWQAVGLSYSELVERLIALAISDTTGDAGVVGRRKPRWHRA